MSELYYISFLVFLAVLILPEVVIALWTNLDKGGIYYIRYPLSINLINAILFIVIIPKEFGGASLEIIFNSIQTLTPIWAMIITEKHFLSLSRSFIAGSLVFAASHLFVKGGGFLVMAAFPTELGGLNHIKGFLGAVLVYGLVLPIIFLVSWVIHITFGKYLERVGSVG